MPHKPASVDTFRLRQLELNFSSCCHEMQGKMSHVDSRARNMRALNLICAAEGSAYFLRCTNDTSSGGDGFCSIACGAQPEKKIISKVARTRPQGSPKRSA